MAQQKSLIKIEGTLDGLTFYRDQDGTYRVKTKSGVSKNRIDNDPAFERTRENGREFAEITQSGKKLRRALSTLLADVQDKTKVYRLTSVLSKVKNLDTTSIRGERKVSLGLATPEGKNTLKYFDFNAKARMDAVLRTDYQLDTTNFEISIPEFVPQINLNTPQGATHVEISAAWLNFDLETNSGDMVVSNKENLQIDNNETNVILSFSQSPTSTGVDYYLLKVVFFQEINSQQYLLNNGVFNAMQFIEII